MNSARCLSMINLVFRYTALAEFLSAHPVSDTGDSFENRIHHMNVLIRRYFSAEAPVDPDEAEELRKENVADMEDLTALTDVFQADEYVLNRLEYGLKDYVGTDYTDGELTDLLIAYFSRIPKEIQNEAIISVIEQLPIRMTKNRFLDLLKERMGIYRGGDLSVFKARLQMLLTVAGAHKKDLFTLMDMPADHVLSAPELKVSTEEEFDVLSDSLSVSGELLDLRMDLASSIQDTLNSFEAVLISAENDLPYFELEEECRTLILQICEIIEAEDYAHPELIYESLHVFEGYPERYAQEISPLFSETCSDEQMYSLSVLMSSSPFALLQKGSVEETLSDSEFRLLYKEFSDTVSSRLSSVNRTYARALMGRMNAMIPPRFTSQEELENYILNSLSGCTNNAERAAVTKLLEELMKEG